MDGRAETDPVGASDLPEFVEDARQTMRDWAATLYWWYAEVDVVAQVLGQR